MRTAHTCPHRIFPQTNAILHLNQALDKREYLVIIRGNFCQFCTKTYVVTPHLNRLDKMVQMRGNNIWFKQTLLIDLGLKE